MSPDNIIIEWWDKPDLSFTIDSGYNKLSIKLETGKNPKIKCNISIKRFLESLKETDLNYLISLCELRKKCLT